MATIRFYTDEHVARAVVRGLRERGVDVLTVTEAGLPGAADDAHLARAQRGGLVHRGRDFRDTKAAVTRNQVEEAISVCKHLVERTDDALGTSPKEIQTGD